MGEFSGMFAEAFKMLLAVIFVYGFFLGLGIWVLYQFTGPWDSCLKIFGIGGCF